MPERTRLQSKVATTTDTTQGPARLRAARARSALNQFFTTTAETIVLRVAPGARDDSRPPAMGEDMNKAMAWTIAGVGRRTQDAAEEAARRAGMRLDDWLDEAIADQAALAQRAPPQDNEAEDERLGAAAGRLERIARRIGGAREPQAPGIPNSLIRRSSASRRGSHAPKRGRRARSNRSPRLLSARIRRATPTGRR